MSEIIKQMRIELACMLSNEHKLSLEAHCVYLLLIDASEGEDRYRLSTGKYWRDVYLDNAKPKTMTDTMFRAYLGVLYKAGLYANIDDYVWGEVRIG